MSDLIIDGIEMSYEEAHRMLWNWLAENPNCNNGDFFEFHKCSEHPLNDCFACEKADRNCKHCPIKWTYYDSEIPCYEEYKIIGEHEKITSAERVAQAKQIAELPWKTGGWW
jgi:hypothetical protein